MHQNRASAQRQSRIVNHLCKSAQGQLLDTFLFKTCSPLSASATTISSTEFAKRSAASSARDLSFHKSFTSKGRRTSVPATRPVCSHTFAPTSAPTTAGNVSSTASDIARTAIMLTAFCEHHRAAAYVSMSTAKAPELFASFLFDSASKIARSTVTSGPRWQLPVTCPENLNNCPPKSSPSSTDVANNTSPTSRSSLNPPASPQEITSLGQNAETTAETAFVAFSRPTPDSTIATLRAPSWPKSVRNTPRSTRRFVNRCRSGSSSMSIAATITTSMQGGSLSKRHPLIRSSNDVAPDLLESRPTLPRGFKCLEHVDQFVDALSRKRVVNAGSHAADTAVAL